MPMRAATRHRHPVSLPRLRALALVAVLAMAVALLVACGDDDSGRLLTPEATPTTATETAVPTATPFPTGDGVPGGTTTPTSTETPSTGPSDGPGADEAVAVLDRYFSAIGTRNYEAAYVLWRGQGEASGQTLEEFVDGFGETASISWEIGEPGRIDPGAGQRYIEIPVRIVARTTSGESQQFEGSYVLHRTTDIPGATEEQRQWRIHSADVQPVE